MSQNDRMDLHGCVNDIQRPAGDIRRHAGDIKRPANDIRRPAGDLTTFELNSPGFTLNLTNTGLDQWRDPMLDPMFGCLAFPA